VPISGTSARAFAGAAYVSAGKTGTAQVFTIKQNEKYDESRINERHRDHSLFVAFAPAEAPRIALALLVENGGFGSRAAAPIARQAFDYYLLGKLPEAPADLDDSDEAPTPRPAGRPPVVAQAGGAPAAAATVAARAASASWTATSFVLAPFAAFSAWKRPKCPAPSTATRSVMTRKTPARRSQAIALDGGDGNDPP
jgi:penicillin-binding protein 2